MKLFALVLLSTHKCLNWCNYLKQHLIQGTLFMLIKINNTFHIELCFNTVQRISFPDKCFCCSKHLFLHILCALSPSRAQEDLETVSSCLVPQSIKCSSWTKLCTQNNSEQDLLINSWPYVQPFGLNKPMMYHTVECTA